MTMPAGQVRVQQVAPSIGRVVHYVSRGSADGVFLPACRAATVTEVGAGQRVGLAVVNPDGLFFHPLSKDGGVEYSEGLGRPGKPDCPDRDSHSSIFRYCPCGWTEDGHTGGTWHWPERV